MRCALCAHYQSVRPFYVNGIRHWTFIVINSSFNHWGLQRALLRRSTFYYYIYKVGAHSRLMINPTRLQMAVQYWFYWARGMAVICLTAKGRLKLRHAHAELISMCTWQGWDPYPNRFFFNLSRDKQTKWNNSIVDHFMCGSSYIIEFLI